ncbi:NAD(P)H-hydrate dehydratase [Thermoanaerobacterium sp. RBIITD]|uniref:NAD(P)H-hydrate dehydratase n=1 Tax=Thermoanaerobacterium sp. RBIITD TaxID=1550240 RepID=UPI000BB684DA|nr:NAD(P)H-hydrate dehydratase [Thermoanaerobacterium sp. RBIITD]SNX54512.1 NAD(P)H-hydrate epimerase [Thermoanaerobacterium sp. RBIITD]
MKVLSNKEMKDLESTAINTIGIPSICLMENAGRIVAEYTKEYLLMNNKVNALVICGKGNNGGDGYVAARYLYNSGFDVKVFITTSSAAITGDAKKNLDIIMNMGIFVAEIIQKEQIKLLEKNIMDCDIIIDAIYGTGLSGEICGTTKEIIDIINKSGKYIISADIPSGINGDTGHIEGCAVKANKTITMGFIKKGLTIYPGVEYSGDIVIADIGIPKNIIEQYKNTYNIITHEDVKITKRNRNTHKGDYGKLLIIAGSKNMTGAAALCAMSAIKTGCGIVRLAVPQKIQPVLQGSLKEIITYGIKDKDGIFYKDSVDEILEISKDADVVAIGPGLTNCSDIKEFVENIIISIDKPLVIDADALNVLSSIIDIIKGRDIILTPHLGEMSRLIGITIDEIKNDIFGVTQYFINKYKVTLVLKGSRTVIGNSDSGIYINNTGNPGMATAGSGDVLTGMISSFLAQGLSNIKAAIYGAYYHGKAGDLASYKYGEYSLTASNIIEYIHEAIKSG